MTDKEKLELDQLRATVEKLRAEVKRLTQQEDDELEQIRMTNRKLSAETAKLVSEMRFPPVIVAALIIGVISPVALATIAIFAN